MCSCDERETVTRQDVTPLPAIQPSTHTVPMMVTNANVMSGGVPILPVLLPWQHEQVNTHTGLFEAHHNITGNTQNNTKREPWFKKFKYRYIHTCISISNYYFGYIIGRPMSENRAALIIQRHCRGYLTRRNLEFQQYLSNRWLAGRLVDKIIDEVLRDDVIPDILIELLQERVSCGGWVCYLATALLEGFASIFLIIVSATN